MLVHPLELLVVKSYRLGLEIDADIKLNDQFSIKSNAAFSTNKNEDFTAPINGNLLNLGNTPLSFSPNVIVGNMLVYQPSQKPSNFILIEICRETVYEQLK